MKMTSTSSRLTRRKIIPVLVFALLALMIAACGPAKEIGFQFQLTDAAGNPINGDKNVTVKLYKRGRPGSGCRAF